MTPADYYLFKKKCKWLISTCKNAQAPQLLGKRKQTTVMFQATLMRMAYKQKPTNNNPGEDMRRSPFSTADGSVGSYSHYGNQYGEN